MSDQTLEFILYAGILLVAIGGVWLLATAFHRSFRRGLAVSFIPLLIPWHIATAWPKTLLPSLVLATGIAAAAFPLAYTRLRPVDLGERVRLVEGEKHVTLNGWNESDYAVLRQHPDVVVLQMANPDVNDDTLTLVSSLVNLKELDIDGTAVTDAGLTALAPLAKLERLRISRTGITDAGFQQSIAPLPALKQLWCPETAISKTALNEWKAGLAGRRFIGGQEAPATPPSN